VQTAPGSGRVRLHLMGSVRHFARLQASAAGTLDGLEARQVQWAARTVPPLAERVWRTGHPDAWAELEVERENLLHAWKRATDEDDRRTLLIALGPLLPEIPEAPRMLDAALSGASGQRRGTLLALQGGLLRIRGRLPEAADSLRAALRLLPEEHLDARGARLSLALLHTDSGEHDEALPLLSALAQAEPPDAIAGSAAVHWGQALHSLGQSTRARRVVLEGLDMLRDLGARRLMATTFNVLSRFHDEQEEQHLRDALAIHRQEGNRRGEAVTLTNLVNALADAGRWQEMWAVADEARAAHQALGARRSEGILLSNLCGIALSCWELDRAEALGQQAIRICRAHGVTLFEGQALLNLGIGALTERRHDDALARLQRARDIFDELDTPVMLAVVEGVIAATEAALDQPAAASARLEAVLASGVLDSRPEEAAQHLAAARGRIAALQEGGTLRADLDTTEVRGMVRLLSEAIAWQTG
jgi:tetratricopeptide (TPR) repeat protein